MLFIQKLDSFLLQIHMCIDTPLLVVAERILR